MASLDEQFLQQLQQLQVSNNKTPIPRLPTFAGLAGEDMADWLDLLSISFQATGTSATMATAMTLNHMVGTSRARALAIIRQYQLAHNTLPPWDFFQESLKKAFANPNAWLLGRLELMDIRQTGALSDYITAFTIIRQRTPSLSEYELISAFIHGLSANLRQALLAQPPVSIADAICRAETMAHVPAHSPMMDVNAVPAVRKGSSCRFCKRSNHSESRCWTKFPHLRPKENRGTRRSINVTEEIKSDSEYLYVGATANKRASSLLVLEGTLNAIPCRFLIDSGAAGNLVTSAFLEKNGSRSHTVVRVPKQTLVLANGKQLTLDTAIHRPAIRLPGSDIEENISQLGIFPSMSPSYDVILGLPWLRDRNPLIDWTRLTINWSHSVPVTGKPDTFVTLSEEPCLFLGVIDSRHVEDSDETSLCFVTTIAEEQASPVVPKWLQETLNKFSDVFSDTLPSLPTKGPFHQIKVHSDDPICLPLRRMSPLELDALRKTLDDLLTQGFIRPSSSPWGAPILFVKKKDGSLRLCVDYRALNKVTVKNKYPIPLIDELLDRLAGAKFFSALDLCSGYHQVRMHPDSIEKSAFRTRYGSFEWLVMPFGLTNAPATFMAFMHSIFHNVVDDFAIVYMDDILIFSKTEEEHARHVETVLELLRDNGLYLKPAKCRFLQNSIEYLGYRVSAEGLLPSPSKIEAIKSLATPKNVADVRKFLGLTGYYRRFVREYASIAKPLSDLLRDSVEFVWSKECQQSFEALSRAIISEPLLRLPDFSRPFIITSDASDIAVGGVLSQVFDDGEHPIAYESKKMDDAHSRRPIVEQELYAVYHCVKAWRCYVEGPGFHLRTDHANLLHVFKPSYQPSRAAARWIIDLTTNYKFTVEYIPGSENVVADALSRPTSDKPDILVVNALVPNMSPTQHFQLVKRIHLEHGHRSAASTYQEVRKLTQWPNMRKDVFDWVGSCPRCLAVDPQIRPRAPFHIRSPVKILERWGLDAIGPLPATTEGYTYLLVAIDHASRYAFVKAVRAISAQETVIFLRDLIRTFGCPKSLVTDRGTNFMAIEFTSFLRRRGIEHEPTVAFHPQSNGLTERFNGTLQHSLMKLMASDRTSWIDHLDDAVNAYNRSIHSATAESPFSLLYGLSNEDSDNAALMERRAAAASRSLSRAEKSKLDHDKRLLLEPLVEGDLVFQRRPQTSKLQTPWIGPFQVVERGPYDTFTVRSPLDSSRRKILRHRDNLKLVPNKAIYAQWGLSNEEVGEC